MQVSARKTKVVDAERDKDEFLLRLLRLRMRSRPSHVAVLLGLSSARVRVLCNRIMGDDLKFSGEPEPVVRAGYWREYEPRSK